MSKPAQGAGHTALPWRIESERKVRDVVKDGAGRSLFLRETWTPAGAIETAVRSVNALPACVEALEGLLGAQGLGRDKYSDGVRLAAIEKARSALASARKESAP